MGRAVLLSLLLATSCLYAHRNTGRFEVHWNLVGPDGKPGPTCDSHQLGDVLVIVTNVKTGSITSYEDRCSAGAVLTRPLPLGQYELDIQALGTYADLAGDVKLEGTLVDGEDDPTITAAIQVLPPATQLRATWMLTKQDAEASCANLNDPVIRVVTTPQEGAGITSRIWRCAETNTTIDVAYGPFAVTGMLADQQQQILASAGPFSVAATRGLVDVQLGFDVP